MRKLAMLLSVFMLFTTVSTGFVGYAVENTEAAVGVDSQDESSIKYYINEDFSAMNTQDLNRGYWSLDENYGKAEIVDDSVKNIGSTEGRVLELSYVSGTTTQYNCAPCVTRLLPRPINSGKMVIEWRAMYEYAANNTFSLTTMVDGTKKTLLSLMVSVRGIQFNPGPVYSDNIVPGEYADYKIILDMDDRSYDFYINDVIKLEDMAFTDGVSEFSQIDSTAWCEGHGNAAWSYSYLRAYTLDEKVSSENEVIPEEYVNAKGLLKGLGALETVGAGSSINEVLTRGRFALLVAGTLGKPDSKLENINSTVFSDVPISSEYKRAVGYLNMIDIAKTNTVFVPDRDITLLEAVIMAIRALGYDKTISSSENYAQSYMTLATKLKLLKGMKAQMPESKITMGDAMRLMYNMLHTNVIRQESWGENEIYSSSNGYTLLKDIYNVEEYSGKITANEFSGLSHMNGAVGAGFIEIDRNHIFKIKDADNSHLLGYNITFYADTKENICYYAYEDDNDITEVKSDDIVSVTKSGNNIRFTYADGNDKVKTVTISNKSDMLLNGVATGKQITPTDLMPGYGTVTFVENDGVSLAAVESLEEYVFDTYLSDTLYMLDGTRIKLDDYEIRKGSQNISPDEIAEGSSLAVKRITPEIIKISVTQNDDFGIVESWSEDLITVNGKEYEFSPYYAGVAKKELVPGSNILFYIGASGKIIYIDDESIVKPNEKDGYLLDIDDNNGKAFGPLCSFRILDAGEGVVYYDTAKDFRIDGVKYGKSDEIVAKLRQTSLDMKKAGFTAAQLAKLEGTEADQLIRYKYNSKMEITEIITDYWKVSGSRIDPPAGTTNLYNYDSGGALISGQHKDYSVQAFGVHDDKTMLIEVPGINLEDDKYMSMKWTDVASDKWHNDYLIFNANPETRVAEAVISYDDSETNKTIPDSSTIKLVTRIVTTIDEEEELVHKISYIENGAEKTILAKDNKLAADVKAGDILKWVTNNSGKVVHIERFDVSDYMDASSAANYSSWGNIRIGSIVGYDDNYYGVLTRPETETLSQIIRPIYIKDNMDITLFDKTKGVATITEHKELRNYTQSINPDARIVVFESHGTPASIYLIY